MSDLATKHELAEMRRIVGDCFAPNMAVYYVDTTVTAIVAGAAYGGTLYLPLFSPMQVVCFFITAAAVYRLGSFIHEVVHMRRGEHVLFKIYWHLIGGIPLFMPAYVYENHITHHNTHDYGTRDDAEYLPLGASSPRLIWVTTLHILALPLLVVYRFGVLAPLSWACPPVRRWMLRRVSAYGIHMYYHRPVPEDAPLRLWMFIDGLVFLRLGVMATVFATGRLPLTHVGVIYALAVCILLLNWIRSLVAHRYRGDGRPMGLAEQLDDSVNITGDPVLTEIVCPVGLRYHALHHLFPALPYHRLGVAHRRLMKELPADAAYRRTEMPSIRAALIDLYRAAASCSTVTVQSWKQA